MQETYYISMRIFGIDPGTQTTGYGVIDLEGASRLSYVASGVVHTSKDMPFPKRLSTIRMDIIELINEYAPNVVAVESIFFFKNAKTVIPVSQARGVLIEAASSVGLDSKEYTPMQVKQCLTGFGRADKKDIQIAVQALLQLPSIIKPDDASDALAIAICHARMDLSARQLAAGAQIENSALAH